MLNTVTISKNRLKAFELQHGRCHYCHAPMWLENPKEFAAKHHLSVRAAGRLRCTAEHLVAKKDGGNNSAKNIVAACVACNGRRHKAKAELPPERYSSYVKNRLRAGKWHPARIRALCAF